MYLSSYFAYLQKWRCKYIASFAIILGGGPLNHTKALGATFLNKLLYFGLLAILSKYINDVGDGLIYLLHLAQMNYLWC
jgi:hypothetical protein